MLFTYACSIDCGFIGFVKLNLVISWQHIMEHVVHNLESVSLRNLILNRLEVYAFGMCGRLCISVSLIYAGFDWLCEAQSRAKLAEHAPGMLPICACLS